MRTLAQSLGSRVRRLGSETEATTATEYAVMLALIIVVSLAAIGALGDSLANSVAWTVSDSIS